MYYNVIICIMMFIYATQIVGVRQQEARQDVLLLCMLQTYIDLSLCISYVMMFWYVLIIHSMHYNVIICIIIFIYATRIVGVRQEEARHDVLSLCMS